jgi:hypothetical protein
MGQAGWYLSSKHETEFKLPFPLQKKSNQAYNRDSSLQVHVYCCTVTSMFPSKGEWIEKIWYIQAMEFYSVILKNDITSFAKKWIWLEIITLRKISQTKNEKYHI